MRVDVVLEDRGRYWRRRVDVLEAPEPGVVLRLAHPDVTVVVVGVADGEATTGDRAAGAAAVVLVRSRATGPGLAARLSEGGWRALL